MIEPPHCRVAVTSRLFLACLTQALQPIELAPLRAPQERLPLGPE
jgi:hypothetical protein